MMGFIQPATQSTTPVPVAKPAIDLNSAQHKWRRTVGDSSAPTTYGMELSVGGKDYTFIPNSVISKGMSYGGNQYVMPWFLNKDNLASLGNIGIPVDTADYPQYQRNGVPVSQFLKNEAGASTQGVLVPSGSIPFDGEVRTFDNSRGTVIGMGERGGQLVYLQDRGGASDRYMTANGNINTVTTSGGGGLFGGFFDDLVSGVSDFFSGIDDAVNEIPGGWGTVALVGGGVALANAAAAAAPAAAAAETVGATAATGGTLAGMGTGAAGVAATTAATAPTVASLGGLLGGGSTALTGGVIPPVAETTGAGLLSSAANSGSPLAGVGTGATGAEIAGGAGAVGAGTGAGAGVTAPIMPENAGGLLGGGSTALTGGVAPEVGAITAPTIGQMANSSSIVDYLSNLTGISPETIKAFAPSAIQGLLSAGGSYLQSSSAKDAAQIQADAQIRAAQIAADAARFRPVGVTTRFGTSNFTTDAAGNVTGAGYTPSAEITGYQNRLSNLANQGLTGAEKAPAAYAPLTGAAQSLFNLGQGYLKKTPEEVAADYIAKQQALLAPSQEQQLALLQNKLQAQGRGGLSVAQGGNLGATTPEMQAYYNALAQSNLQLAANANQAGQQNVQFGAGLFNTGAGLQNQYYQGQVAAYSPFTNAMDITSGLERLAQQPMDLGTSIGQKVSTANANVGQLTGQGILNAANTMAPANAYSMSGNLLAGAASSPAVTSALNKAFGNTQQPTQQQYTYDPNTKQFVPVQSSSVWG